MDARGIALVVLLLIISGLIAYIGDYVGRKVGKRRVSIFNLRPKHTSIIITIITGILIVSVTLIALFSFSQYARTSFFGLQKIVGELEAKRNQLEESTRKYKQQERELEESTLKYRKQEAELRAGLEQAQKAYAESVEQLQARQKELDEILGQINLKSMELNELQESHGRLLKEYERTRKDTVELAAKKEALEKEIKKAVESMSEMSVETLYGEVLYLKDQLLARVNVDPDIKPEDLKTQLLTMINTILNEAVERGAIVDEDTGMIFNEQFKGLVEVLREADNELIIDALAANNVFKGQQIYIKLRPIENRLVFSKGEVIIEQTFNSGMKRTQVDELLNLMLYQVSLLARRHGMMPDPETQQVGFLPAKRYIELLDRLTGMASPAAVKVVALRNTGVADKLEIDIVVN